MPAKWGQFNSIQWKVLSLRHTFIWKTNGWSLISQPHLLHNLAKTKMVFVGCAFLQICKFRKLCISSVHFTPNCCCIVDTNSFAKSEVFSQRTYSWTAWVWNWCYRFFPNGASGILCIVWWKKLSEICKWTEWSSCIVPCEQAGKAHFPSCFLLNRFCRGRALELF